MMVSEPTIQANFVVRGQRKAKAHPLVLVGGVGLILLFLVGILSLLTMRPAQDTSQTASQSAKNFVAFEAEIIRETITPQEADVISESVALIASLNATETPQTVTTPQTQVQSNPNQINCQIASNDANNVNIRSGPDLEFSTIGVLFAGRSTSASAITDTRWYQVETGDGGRGWIGGSVVKKSGDCDFLPQIKTPVCTIQNTTGNRVNIRTGASTGDAILRVLSPEDLLMADAHTADGWYRLNLAPQVGWVYKDVVALSPACATVPLISPDDSSALEPIATVYSNIAFNENDCVVQSFTGTSVDLREGPGMEFNIRAKLSQPMIASKRSSNGWYEIEGSGWAFAGDLVYRGLCNLLPTVTPDEIRLTLMSHG